MIPAQPELRSRHGLQATMLVVLGRLGRALPVAASAQEPARARLSDQRQLRAARWDQHLRRLPVTDLPGWSTTAADQKVTLAQRLRASAAAGSVRGAEREPPLGTVPERGDAPAHGALQPLPPRARGTDVMALHTARGKRETPANFARAVATGTDAWQRTPASTRSAGRRSPASASPRSKAPGATSASQLPRRHPVLLGDLFLDDHQDPAPKTDKAGERARHGACLGKGSLRDQVGPMPAPFEQVTISEEPTPETRRGTIARGRLRHSDGSLDLAAARRSDRLQPRDDVHCVLLNVRRSFKPLTPVRPPQAFARRSREGGRSLLAADRQPRPSAASSSGQSEGQQGREANRGPSHHIARLRAPVPCRYGC